MWFYTQDYTHILCVASNMTDFESEWRDRIEMIQHLKVN